MSGQKLRLAPFCWSVALWWLCALGGGVAVAQSPSVAAPQAAQAQQHLAAGRAALAKGDLPRAERELEQGYQLLGTPELLGLLGQVALQQGQRTRAADLFRRYLTEATVTAAESQPLLALIQSEQDSAAEIVVSGVAGALLRIDDRIVGRLPLSRLLLMTSEPHRLTLEQPGRRKAHLVKAASGIPVSVQFSEDASSAVDAIEIRPPVVLFLYDQTLKPPAPLARAILDRVRLDGRAYDFAPERAERALSRQPAGCLGDSLCLMRLVRSLGVDYILQLQTAGEDGRFSVQMLDVAVDLPAAPPQLVDCRGRPQPQCAVALRDLVGELLTASLSRQHGRLRIASRPEGAAITVDEQPLDRRTPHELSLFVGDRQIKLSKPGYLTQRTSARVVADMLTEMTLDLPVDLAAQRRQRFAIGKRVLAVAGALAIAGGIVAVGLNGIERNDEFDSNRYQELLSWPHGLAAITVGVVTVGVAIWMHRQEKAAALLAQPAEQ